MISREDLKDNDRSTINSNAIYSKEELKVMIKKMEEASHIFYLLATKIGNHAFIEFCGLMNEYIKLCQQSLDSSIDFTQCNTHIGQKLKSEPYNLSYIREKLECIFGPTFPELTEDKGKTKDKIDKLQECTDRSAIFYDETMKQIRNLTFQNYENLNRLGLLLSQLRSKNSNR